MKIKEVENRTGIPSANIRFYENEGLIRPQRNKENNYREYTEQDIEALKRIKVLRLLGISIDDIKKIFQGEISLEDSVRERIHKIDEEKEQLSEVKRVCENILLQDLDIKSLNEEILGEDQKVWRKRLDQILKEDMTKVQVSRTQLNRQIAGILSAGFLINALVSIVAGGFYQKLSYTANDIWGYNDTFLPMLLFWGPAILMIISGVMGYWSASQKVHLFSFLIATIMLSPFIMIIASMIEFPGTTERIISFLPVFWIVRIVFSILYCVVSEKNINLIMKVRYSLLYAISVSAVVLLLTRFLLSCGWSPFVMTLIGTLYLVLFWSDVNRDFNRYNQYYAVRSAVGLLNPVATIFSYYGKSKTPMWGDFVDKSE